MAWNPFRRDESAAERTVKFDQEEADRRAEEDERRAEFDQDEADRRAEFEHVDVPVGPQTVLEPEVFVNPEIPEWATERWGDDAETKYPAFQRWADESDRGGVPEDPNNAQKLVQDWEASQLEANKPDDNKPRRNR